MAFRTFLSSLGINAPSVETTLGSASVYPGSPLPCTVTLKGGGADVHIESVKLNLVTRLEDWEGTETSWDNPGVVSSTELARPFTLQAGQVLTETVPIDVPWEMPLTHVLGGRPLKGARAAVRTELSIADSVDKGDVDEISVFALPPQDLLLQAYLDLGFRFDEAEVKKGTPRGGENSTQWFWQEIEMWFPPSHRRHGGQLESVFVTRPDSLDLVTGSHGPYPFTYAQMDPATVTQWLDNHLRTTFG